MYAESISVWSNQGSVTCLLSELWIFQSALWVNGNIYFYFYYGEESWNKGYSVLLVFTQQFLNNIFECKIVEI